VRQAEPVPGAEGARLSRQKASLDLREQRICAELIPLVKEPGCLLLESGWGGQPDSPLSVPLLPTLNAGPHTPVGRVELGWGTGAFDTGVGRERFGPSTSAPWSFTPPRIGEGEAIGFSAAGRSSRWRALPATPFRSGLRPCSAQKNRPRGERGLWCAQRRFRRLPGVRVRSEPARPPRCCGSKPRPPRHPSRQYCPDIRCRSSNPTTGYG
jgi:hypothetical protein